jgi:zinc and cadmium transporter
MELVIIFSLLGGLFSLIGGAILLSKKSFAKKLGTRATPFAAGALLAAVFLDLLPEGIDEGGDARQVSIAVLVGIILFFIAERFLRWFHHHHTDDSKHKDPSISLIIAGDTIHNALDGVAIASAFLINVPTGIITTIAVATHEIPQEIGDFALLLNKGMSRKSVLFANAFSALATTATAVITYALGTSESLPVPVLLGLSAGFLLYIALSDVIPTIHESTDDSRFMQLQTFMLIIGVVVVGTSIQVAHQYIDVGHESEHSSQHEHIHDE